MGDETRDVYSSSMEEGSNQERCLEGHGACAKTDINGGAGAPTSDVIRARIAIARDESEDHR
jgi:hypothetical protein